MELDHPWTAEYAKSSRSGCGACRQKIASGELRLGRMVEAQNFDGWYPVWHHFSCVRKKKIAITAIEEVKGFDNLRWNDQQRLRKYIENGDTGTIQEEEDEEDGNNTREQEDNEEDEGEEEEEEEDDAPVFDHTIEMSKSSRALCRVCKDKTVKGEPRISTVENGNRTSQYRHVKCFMECFSWTQPIEELNGWDALDDAAKKAAQDVAKPFVKPLQEHTEVKIAASGKKGSEKKRKLADVLVEEGSKGKRKLAVDEGKKKQSDIATDEDLKGKAIVTEKKDSKDDFETRMKRQSEALWKLQDSLEINVSVQEMKDMIEANNGYLSTSDKELRERCADGMLFGAFKPCPVCGNGPLVFAGSSYRCKGHLSEWSRCNYQTLEIEREPIWEIPQGSRNAFLRKWYQNQKKIKDPRLLRPPSKSSKSEANYLRGLHVFFAGTMKDKTQKEWKTLIEEANGVVHKLFNSGVTVIVSTEAEFFEDESLRQSGIPAVGERYLTECMKAKKRLQFRDYRLESSPAALTKVKVKGRSAVHEESGMENTGHILEVGNLIYSVTLNKSDIVTGRNSGYILQIIEEDKRKVYYVFRKWGRVASGRGNTKLEQHSRETAIQDFEDTFLDKTGNTWHSWVTKSGFQKLPGKYLPIEIDYGADEEPQKQVSVVPGSKTKLHPRVVNLLQMLFDIETYKSAMLEFEINPTEMPLGKLTKAHIARGFDVLTRIQSILERNDQRRDVELIDSSNQFNTLIPSIHPSVIGDEDSLKSKIQMLEALRDIEIASQFIKSVGDDDDSDPLDFHYKKLKCDISPVPHDSAEFNIVKDYLERTHAPTHTEWGLEVEDVFAVSRDGEHDLYAPMKSTLKNRMLLWHGSRTTNFVGILSQGLRIAPPEAPATGYMFGKGVYFADLVSKSAQYCYTSRSNPVGLMLISEVALGEMKEYTHAQYMEKPPSGFHSTKGVGTTMPDPSEFQVFEDSVVVPCGRPVASNTRSDLRYNEFIVYSTSQIQLRFLLKVRFKYKR